MNFKSKQGKPSRKPSAKGLFNIAKTPVFLKKKICTYCFYKARESSLVIKGGQYERICCNKTAEMITIIGGMFFDCKDFRLRGHDDRLE